MKENLEKQGAPEDSGLGKTVRDDLTQLTLPMFLQPHTWGSDPLRAKLGSTSTDLSCVHTGLTDTPTLSHTSPSPADDKPWQTTWEAACRS